MVFLPFTGITMGYFSGKGIPFFGLTIPGKKEPIGDIAKYAYKTHVWAGTAL
jgi:cytochrome b561